MTITTNHGNFTNLVRYDAMCRAISDAYEVDEVKDIRDKAVAMEHYFRQAKNTEAEQRACQIRLRAERKAGEMLAAMEKAKGGRPSENRSSSTTSLSDLGISKDQSSRWQQLANVPEDQFEAALAGPDKPSTSGIIAKPKAEPMDENALFLWGRLRDLERHGVLDRDQNDLLSKMTDGMQSDVRRLAVVVYQWLKGFENVE